TIHTGTAGKTQENPQRPEVAQPVHGESLRPASADPFGAGWPDRAPTGPGSFHRQAVPRRSANSREPEGQRAKNHSSDTISPDPAPAVVPKDRDWGRMR